jgi:hypothetical protein
MLEGGSWVVRMCTVCLLSIAQLQIEVFLELSVLYSGAKSALRMGRPCVEEASKTRLTDSL